MIYHNLKPCPICGQGPEVFFVGSGNNTSEVIACRRGCKPNWNSVVIHVSSSMADITQWHHLGAAWNSLELYTDEQGVLKARINCNPNGFFPEGQYCEWSLKISEELLDIKRNVHYNRDIV